jgi:hypothetical protein
MLHAKHQIQNPLINLFNFRHLQRKAILVPKTATLICGGSVLTIEENKTIYGHQELQCTVLPPENHGIFKTNMATVTHLRLELSDTAQRQWLLMAWKGLNKLSSKNIQV